MKREQYNANNIAKWADKTFSDMIKTHYKRIGKKIPTGFKSPIFNYATYGGNLSAITTFLNLSMFDVKLHEITAGPGEEMDLENGPVIAVDFLSNQLLVELIDPNYNRVNEQVELQQLIEETGGIYLVVSDFSDFIDQFLTACHPGTKK